MNNLNVDRILTESREIYRAYISEKNKSGIFNKSIFEETMSSKYDYLYTNYKSIFMMSMSDKYDYNRLSMMVNMANSVKNNDISEKDASVKVGQVLVDDIVKPQLDKAKKK